MNTTGSEITDLKGNLDQLFLIIMGMIVLFMQCGFAFIEAGAVRSKNVTNILIKNILDSFISGIAYWIIGYAFAFGNGNYFIGHEYFVFVGLPNTKLAHFFFQYVFAATAATIVSGAVAERCEFVAYLAYSFLIAGFIYPVVTHWAWHPEGWLAVGMTYPAPVNANNVTNETISISYQDFAGSGVVHIVGGVAAFTGAAFLGPRIGRYDITEGCKPIPGHSVPLSALGGFILIFGFLAFNGGSEGAISGTGNAEAVSLAVVNTVISASVAAFTTLQLNKLAFHCRIVRTSTWSLLSTLNSAITGMVGGCAGCNVFYAWGAAAVGFMSALSYIFFAFIMVKLKIDDPVNACAVHFGGGIVGVLTVALFQKDIGVVFVWDRISGLRLLWQLIGVGAIIGWTSILSILMFGALNITRMLRVPGYIETWGLDIPKHGEPAYPIESNGWLKAHTHATGKVDLGFDTSDGSIELTKEKRRLPNGMYDISSKEYDVKTEKWTMESTHI